MRTGQSISNKCNSSGTVTPDEMFFFQISRNSGRDINGSTPVYIFFRQLNCESDHSLKQRVKIIRNVKYCYLKCLAKILFHITSIIKQLFQTMCKILR